MSNIIRRRLILNDNITPSPSKTTYLYYWGDECTDITGGWYDAWNFSNGIGTFTKNSNNFYMKPINNGGQNGYICTNNSIDLSTYTYIGSYSNSFTGSTNATWWELFSTKISTPVSGTTRVKQYDNTTSHVGLRITQISYSGSLYITRDVCWGWEIYQQAIFLAQADDVSVLSSYGSTISAILANSTTMMSTKSGIKNMLTCTGDFMWSAVTNDTWKSAYNSSAYKSLIAADKNWAKAIAMM